MTEISIPVEKGSVNGTLEIPMNAKGLVVFAHGSGSSRFSPRNRFVAEQLQKAGLATLLMDLLTEQEERIDDVTTEYRFNIPLLADRLVLLEEWLRKNPKTKNMKFGYFGSSTGAAAALIAAAKHPEHCFAIISRGGRPDLAMDVLTQVKAPTLLIVGSNDEPVIDMNEQALRKLRCIKKLEIIPGATHLFEESGALGRVAKLAKEWFAKYLK